MPSWRNQGRTPLSDREAADFCGTLRDGLREKIASVLWWDNVERQKTMPRTRELSKQDNFPVFVCEVERDEIVKTLQQIGYNEHRAIGRISPVEYTEQGRINSRKYREKKKLNEQMSETTVISGITTGSCEKKQSAPIPEL